MAKSRREQLVSAGGNMTRDAIQAKLKHKRSVIGQAEGESGVPGSAKPNGSTADPDFSINLALRPRSSYAIRSVGGGMTPGNNQQNSFINSSKGKNTEYISSYFLVVNVINIK